MESWTPPSGYSPIDRRKAREEAARAKRVKLTAFFVLAVALVVFSAVWNPPTAKVHSFSKASDYKASNDSGCTNSGEGCHGDETEYTDFNDYHEDAECTTCHDYQGVGCIPCHSPHERECPACHDGTVEGSPDVVRLSDPYPRGHYRETTHTAMGTDMDRAMRARAGGKAKATCADCHSRDLKESHTGVKPVAGSTYGKDIGCGECHNDVRASGLAEVLDGWKGRACEDCHKLGSSAPMHAPDRTSEVEGTSEVGCASSGRGCHRETDLHRLHADAPRRCSGVDEKGERGCHDLDREAHVPKGKSCGGDGDCHRRYEDSSDLHEHGAEVHSPENRAAAGRTYRGIACGSCHHMEADGRSLVTEHALPTASGKDSCRRCHNDPASQEALEAGWPERGNADACEACHAWRSLGTPHSRDTTASHASDSEGCGDTGAGCHPGSELNDVGEPTVDGGLHRDCLRCHDKDAEDGNRAYDPDAKTCGSGRACHDQSYDPRTAVHDGPRGRTDGRDDAHTAGRRQRQAVLTDDASGVSVACGTCHRTALGAEHSRPNASIADGKGTLCVRCHNADARTSRVVKSDWAAKTDAAACAACHSGGESKPHARIDSHEGRELAEDGSPKAGACKRSGCHATLDVRVLHRRLGCVVSGCHGTADDIFGKGTLSCGGLSNGTGCHIGYSARGGHDKRDLAHGAVELDTTGAPKPGYCMNAGCHPTEDLATMHGSDGCEQSGCHGSDGVKLRSCGGTDDSASCHAGYSPTQHFVDHDASIEGTVAGIPYARGENAGCFGCHRRDLMLEHSDALITGSMEGRAASSCRVCHFDADDPGSGPYSLLPAVTDAVASGDKRCTSCHRSGHGTDGPEAAASPHRALSSADVLRGGEVWADPLSEWKAAFESPTGGGHNSLPREAVGASRGKRFPVTSFTIGGDDYTWALPPNYGTTRWLREQVSSADDIRGMDVTCQDCHEGAEEMRGPQGAAVEVRIDPAYSQTAYANPDRRELRSQFDATGTDRVVCFKCHTLQSGSVVGTDAPGGNPVHAQHAQHPGFPSYNPVRYGEKCVDCHVRIPHAWKRPRLLRRTVDRGGADGDRFPSVPRESDGLAGVRLGSFLNPEDLTPDDCATGGCHGRHNPNTHPMPSDIPTATFWP